MADQPQELDSASKLALGLSILAFALTAQVVLVYNNVGFVSSHFGWAVLLCYLAAAWAVLALPVVKVHLGPQLHLRFAQIAAITFCSWISLEEHLHASEGWKAPAGATHLAEAVFDPGTASRVVLVIFVALIFVMIEVFSHLIHTGWSFVFCWWCEPKKAVPARATRRKKV